MIAAHMGVLQDRLKALQTDLERGEARLRMFKPDINLSGVKVRPVPGHTAALYGGMTNAIMETLRETRGPLSIRQIVKGVMERRKLATDDSALVASIQNA